MLNKKEFEILKLCLKINSQVTQRELASLTSFSLGTINKIYNSLLKKGYINKQYKVLYKGKNELNKYKVNNAIIMAAGLSSRFVPLSYDKPKGLLMVKGEILIERQINQLKEAGIEDIYIVVGYKKELYLYLQKKYKVKFIINNEYNTRNNNGSIWLAREYLNNSYICSSDNYFVENPFEKYVYQSYYAVEYMKGQSNERGVKVNSNDRILKTYPNAKDAWALLGHVYWNRDFSLKFIEKLKTIYDDEATKSLLWERVFDKFLNDLPPLYIKRYYHNIFEFDSIEDLKRFDPYFLDNIDSNVFKNICSILKCNVNELHNFEVMKAGQTNETCTFQCNDKKYVYRNCSAFTRMIVNREREKEIQEIVDKAGIDTTVLYIDAHSGWKISRFVDSKPREFSEIVDDVIDSLHEVHCIKRDLIHQSFDFELEIDRIKGLIASSTKSYDSFEEDLFKKIKKLIKYVNFDKWEKTLCHNDINAGNFLFDNGKKQLIDWEYAGLNDPGYDIAKLVLKTESKGDEAKKIISKYYGRQCTVEEERHILACGAIEDYYWSIWGIYLELNGRNLGDAIITWYTHAREYADIAIKMYESEKYNNEKKS